MMKQTILQSWQALHWPTPKSTHPTATGEGVVDEAVFNTIEVDKLFDAVNCAATTVGQAVLYHSLTHPSDNLAEIQAKQDAVREIESNEALAASLATIVQTAKDTESNFYRLLFGEFVGSFTSSREEHEIEGCGHLHYRRGVRFVLDFVGQVQYHAKPQALVPLHYPARDCG